MCKGIRHVKTGRLKNSPAFQTACKTLNKYREPLTQFAAVNQRERFVDIEDFVNHLVDAERF